MLLLRGLDDLRQKVLQALMIDEDGEWMAQ